MRVFHAQPDGSGVLVERTERPAPWSGMAPIVDETTIVELTAADVALIVAAQPKQSEPTP